MEGEGITTVDPPPSPPSHSPDIPAVEPASYSPDISAVESAGDEDPVVDSGQSDDDDAPLAASAPAPNTAPSAEELRARIIKQVEYYFSDENLPNDKFLLKQMKKDKAGFVSISLIGAFRKMKKLTKDVSLIAEALKESSQLVVSSDGRKVKRLHPLPLSEAKDPKSCTVVVENIPEDHSIENIRKICGQVGRVKNITIHDLLTGEDAEQSNKADKRITGRLHALVEYDTVEAAEKAVANLNDETDWRNGLRVQLLRKRMGYGFGRKARKGSDSEKGSHAAHTRVDSEKGSHVAHARVNSEKGTHAAHARVDPEKASHAAHARVDSEKGSHAQLPVGDESNNQSNEQQGEPDDEDGEHTSKERNGRRSRKNRFKGRRYHGHNGMGHGSAPVEVSKPPPGPRMPDGTRGFTMGRGRPPVVQGV